MGKLSLGLGLGVGYVLGTRAGRSQYEQIKRAAAGVMERPEVQQALERAKTAAPAPLQGSIEKLSRRGSGGQGAGAGTVGGEATILEAEVVVTPSPAVSDLGAPDPVNSPLADPLIPPAKSVDDPGLRP